MIGSKHATLEHQNFPFNSLDRGQKDEKLLIFLLLEYLQQDCQLLFSLG
jgi:hypothetical protein